MAKKIETSVLMETPVWFITGCSSGFGRHLAECALEKGYCVVATALDPSTIQDLENKGSVLILKLDVTDQQQVDDAIQAAEAKFGHVDVLINNAGIGYIAAIEESDEAAVRNMFEVNLFGLSRMIHGVLPHMRKRRKGFIVNFSSIAGLHGFPAIGYYSATKFAVEGLSETLWQEVEPFGIKVMLVEPSGFRTNWFAAAEESPQQIPDYAATAGAFRKQLRTDTQPGDPARAAIAIINAVESASPPHRLLLGNTAVEMAMKHLQDEKKEFMAWEAVARSTDFPVHEHAI